MAHAFKLDSPALIESVADIEALIGPMNDDGDVIYETSNVTVYVVEGPAGKFTEVTWNANTTTLNGLHLAEAFTTVEGTVVGSGYLPDDEFRIQFFKPGTVDIV